MELLLELGPKHDLLITGIMILLAFLAALQMISHSNMVGGNLLAIPSVPLHTELSFNAPLKPAA